MLATTIKKGIFLPKVPSRSAVYLCHLRVCVYLLSSTENNSCIFLLFFLFLTTELTSKLFNFFFALVKDHIWFMLCACGHKHTHKKYPK
jgi:hypothetical protein